MVAEKYALRPFDMSFLKERSLIIDEHRRIILEMRTIEQEISERLKHKDQSWRELEKKRNALYVQIEPLVEKYWDILPAVELSGCPYCNQKLSRLFDPVDLNGFWWMDRTQRPRPQPDCCAHFCLLTGSLNFNNLPAVGGLFECLPGPDAPYVIPRILELPSMKAVVSCIEMQCGYHAYSVAYFAQNPPAQQDLTHSWAQKVFHFKDKDGNKGWDIRQDAFDYALASWIKLGKLLVYSQGRLIQDMAQADFLNIKGNCRPQSVIDNQLRFR
jgi:hypothetical protein